MSETHEIGKKCAHCGTKLKQRGDDVWCETCDFKAKAGELPESPGMSKVKSVENLTS